MKLIVQTLLWFGGMGVLLFLSAGTLNWPGAWAFLGVMIGLGLALLWQILAIDWRNWIPESDFQ
ncbi:MAG: hypothetical protein WCE38_12215 [Burkholderiales bacterium]